MTYVTPMLNVTHRPLYAIAEDIERHWIKVAPYAKPYLVAMHSLGRVTDKYFLEDGRSIVLYFLSNASSFRGPEAKALKLELKALLT